MAFTIKPEVSWGHLISAGTMLVAAVAGFYKLSAEVDHLGSRLTTDVKLLQAEIDHAAEVNAASRAAIIGQSAQAQLEMNRRLADLSRAIERLNDRLDAMERRAQLGPSSKTP